MKTSLTLAATVVLVSLKLAVSAATRYVDGESPSPTPPYTSWATAAATIQDAVDAATAGDEIVVTNGIYANGGRAVVGLMTNRVAVMKPLTVRSVNGPLSTHIHGYQLPGITNGDGAIRCVYLTNGAILSGFTLTGGATLATGDGYAEQSGGGLWCESQTAMAADCILAGNSAANAGGGAYSGTLSNCILTNNSATWWGGGAYFSTLSNCTLTANSAVNGGGAYVSALNGCTLTANSAQGSGGGVYEGTLNHCTLHENSATWGGAACSARLDHCMLTENSARSGGGAHASTLNNCTLTGNSAGLTGGGTTGGTLNNCTLTGNSALEGGGAFGDPANGDTCTVNNGIIYFNDAATGANSSGANLSYCCTTPLPGGGIGNIDSEPLFVDYARGDLRLQPDSPCVNAGNNGFADTGGTDLDGNPRIVGGRVDIGAYESQDSSQSPFYTWLQKYELPADGSADHADSDGDGLDNWQEWRCDTNPTNRFSVLRMVTVTKGAAGVQVTWQSVPTRTYRLERATALTSPPSFSSVASNIAGQIEVTTYTDTAVAGGYPLFYRAVVGD